ncbi:MAG TPA: tetraacyldisaccharide 4'-kinase, partial [Nitrospirota bacterium]|nr:tetraacyldisaccharide 4'-kinase [Nitrospirota bacterium]
GYQHVRLKRDLNIVLIDADDPFGNGRLFPAGILREPLQALARADVVLITRADKGREFNAVRRVIERYTAAPVFTASHIPAGLKDIMTGDEKSLSTLRGMPLLAFSGIARPQAFFSLLRELDASVKKELPFPDHYPYRSEDLDRIRCMAREAAADMIITTEKDAVRLRGLDPSGVWSLRIEQMVREKDAWNAVVTNRT